MQNQQHWPAICGQLNINSLIFIRNFHQHEKWWKLFENSFSQLFYNDICNGGKIRKHFHTFQLATNCGRCMKISNFIFIFSTMNICEGNVENHFPSAHKFFFCWFSFSRPQPHTRFSLTCEMNWVLFSTAEQQSFEKNLMFMPIFPSVFISLVIFFHLFLFFSKMNKKNSVCVMSLENFPLDFYLLHTIFCEVL